MAVIKLEYQKPSKAGYRGFVEPEASKSLVKESCLQSLGIPLASQGVKKATLLRLPSSLFTDEQQRYFMEDDAFSILSNHFD